jgi:hypothetical protein
LSGSPEGNNPLFVSLAQESKQPIVVGHVTEVKGDDLRNPSPRSIEQFKDGSISKRERIVAVNAVKERPDIFFAEGLRQARRNTDRGCCRRGIISALPLVNEKLKEATQARSRSSDARCGMRRQAQTSQILVNMIAADISNGEVAIVKILLEAREVLSVTRNRSNGTTLLDPKPIKVRLALRAQSIRGHDA